MNWKSTLKETIEYNLETKRNHVAQLQAFLCHPSMQYQLDDLFSVCNRVKKKMNWKRTRPYTVPLSRGWWATMNFENKKCDGWTDQPTNTASSRVACPRPKEKKTNKKKQWYAEC